MKLEDAIARSTTRMAARIGKGGLDIYARKTPMGIRIVNGYTDPTVVRKPNKTDLACDLWKPVK